MDPSSGELEVREFTYLLIDAPRVPCLIYFTSAKNTFSFDKHSCMKGLYQ